MLNCHHLQPLCVDGLGLSHPATLAQPIEVVIINEIIAGVIGLIGDSSRHSGNGGEALALCYPICS